MLKMLSIKGDSKVMSHLSLINLSMFNEIMCLYTPNIQINKSLWTTIPLFLQLISGIELDLLVNRGTRAAAPALSETGQCSTPSVSEPSGKAGLAAKQECFGSLSLFSSVGKETFIF